MATRIKRPCFRHELNKHAAHSYALQIHGKEERKTDASWSKEDAQAASADA